MRNEGYSGGVQEGGDGARSVVVWEMGDSLCGILVWGKLWEG